MKLKIIGIVLFCLVIIQFIPTKIENNEASIETDYIKATNMPYGISLILKESCYDCHSNKVELPWYSNIAPISWLIKHDVEDGREHLNFSDWKLYEKNVALHKIQECYELVQNNSMPMYSYTLLHPTAKLTKDEKNKLLIWFNANGQSTEKEMHQQKIEYYDGD